MKKTFNKILILCAVALVVTACDENAIPELTEPVADDSTFVKFFLNSDDAPVVNFYFDDKKVSAVSSSTDDEVKGNAYGTVFPSNAYALISAGSFNINAKDLEGNIVATKSFTFENDKHYSAYLLGAEESYEINETIIQISNSENKSLDEFFKPLDNSEYSIRFLSKRKGRKSVLRLYAIRIEANLYVITGGAIKLPLQHLMQDRKHTQIELNKINTAKEQLENERIFDKDSFFEFLNEMP